MPNPLNLLCAISLAAALVMGARLYFAESENTRLERELALAAEVNAENARELSKLAGWTAELERAAFAAAEDAAEDAGRRVRAAKTLERERNESVDFKTWYDTPAYPHLDRLLREALGQGGDNRAHPAPSPAAGLRPNRTLAGNPD